MAGGKHFWKDRRGTMVIEAAFVIPVLGILCIGGFEASQIVARHTEIQTSMAEASAIVQANPPETKEQRDTIEDVIETSTGLPDHKVTLDLTYRCGVEESFAASENICLGVDADDDDDDDDGGYTEEEISTFIRIRIQDSYTPSWTDFGIGKPVNFDVTRTVQVS